MKNRVSLLPIGDELTTGAITDTNAQFLATELTERGYEVVRICSVRDRLEDIESVVRLSLSDSSVVITTGGLGPTTDDITRDAIARVAEVQLILNQDSLKRMEDNYRRRNIPLNRISDRQAYFPESSQVIVNTVGTADSFLITLGDTLVYSIPGVPSEARAIATQVIFPELERLNPGCKKRPGAFLKVFGFSESHLGTVIENAKLPEQIRVAYRPVFPEIWLRFSDERELCSPPLSELVERVKENIGRDHIVSTAADRTLAEVVLEQLRERKLTLGCAESCTAGMIGSSLVAVPGASSTFVGSAVVYSLEAKRRLLGVVANEESVVSETVALEMAKAAQERFGCDVAISITGFAGPEGGTTQVPVGTVCYGLVGLGREVAVSFVLPFERNRMRGYAAHLGMDLIRRYLNGYVLNWERK